MSNETVEEKIRDVLAKKLGIDPSQISGETRLAEDLGLDSFGGIEIIFEIEEAFGLKIADSDFQDVRTVKDIVSYIVKYQAAVHPDTPRK
jgi:acyl carrier protein